MEELTAIVNCPRGFYDMRVYKERVAVGGQVEVPMQVYRQMKASDPTVELVEKKLALNPDALARIKDAIEDVEEEIEDAKEEIAELEEVVEEVKEETNVKPKRGKKK